jgi:hypothetical protein
MAQVAWDTSNLKVLTIAGKVCVTCCEGEESYCGCCYIYGVLTHVGVGNFICTEWGSGKGCVLCDGISTGDKVRVFGTASNDGLYTVSANYGGCDDKSSHDRIYIDEAITPEGNCPGDIIGTVCKLN